MVKTKTNKKFYVRPNFIKDSKGNVLNVLLDLETYDQILDRINEFDEIKKDIQKKQQKAQKK